MIPKIIHYCWFGNNPLPELSEKCIQSWQKYCSDYTIIEWNESNFDIESNQYVKEAYDNKKWAFVTDYVRLYALVNYGGFYLDTDVELLKPLDELCKYEAVSGFESLERIPTGLMACQKHQIMFEELLNEYNNLHFILPDGSQDLTTNVKRITESCLKYGLKLNNTEQTVNGFTLLPSDYLCPKDPDTRKINITSNTICIHHFDGSWLSEEDRYFQALKDRLVFIPGGSYIAKFISIVKYHGAYKAVRETLNWLARRD